MNRRELITGIAASVVVPAGNGKPLVESWKATQPADKIVLRTTKGLWTGTPEWLPDDMGFYAPVQVTDDELCRLTKG